MSSVKRDEYNDDLGEIRTRFVVGIDLGTTNCAMAFVDLDASERRVEVFSIPQATAVGVLEERETLPSFFCRSGDAPTTPWNVDESFDFSAKNGKSSDGKRGVVGVFARDFGPTSPESFVSSAKSWLCRSGVDRLAKILPWNGDSQAETSDGVRGSRARRWSPVDVSSFYLAHLRAAWNARFPEFPLETQDVAVAIPASFDETARELTIRAAKIAGLPRIVLVEEPQAAFYSWLAGRENDWTNFVRPGEKALVCDVGGGTTDFALIYALEKSDGEVGFYRIAVGEHLILGGDNLDLAVFRYLEQKFVEKGAPPTTPRARAILGRESREIKEAFLSGPVDESADFEHIIKNDIINNKNEVEKRETRRVVLPNAGSKLIGGSVSVEVDRREIERLLLDGFFPRVPASSVPARRRGGVRELTLQFANDPAITKYLAAFLTSKRDAALELERAGAFGTRPVKTFEADADSTVDRARPDVVLFNGGAFESEKLRARIVDSLVDWFGGSDSNWRPTVLRNENLYLAVARGAAYYGLARRGLGTRVGASLARTYYVGVAFDENLEKKDGFSDEKTSENSTTTRAVCLLPASCEPGDEIQLDKTFELAIDRPVAFPIFVSSVRTTDAPGEAIDVAPSELRELPPIQTTLKTRSQAKKDAKSIRVRLVARPTEIGTIELFLQEVDAGDVGSRRRASRWTLQFDVRGATQTDWKARETRGEEEGVLDEEIVENGRRVLFAAFASDAEFDAFNEKNDAKIERIRPNEAARRLSEAVGTSRDAFPIPLLRRLAETTLELESGRRRGAAVEARWLNWLGFALRPGFGAAADDWRVEQVWKTVGGALAFRTSECRTQYWILWRRVASGLSAGRQQTLAEPLVGNLRDFRRNLVDGRGKGPELDLTSQEGAEIWRTLGALELLSTESKEEIGGIILDVLSKKRTRPVRDALVWALGRLGARVPFDAPLDRVVAPNVAENWARRLLESLESRADAPTSVDFFALAQLTRKANEKTLDVAEHVREIVAAFLTKHDAAAATAAALANRGGRVVDAETQALFGESLPLGLRWNKSN